MTTDLDRVARLGAYAGALRADENFKDIVRGLKDDAIRDWSNAQSVDDREACWRDLQAVGRFELKLKILVDAFTVEKAKQEAEKKKLDRTVRRQEEMERG